MSTDVNSYGVRYHTPKELNFLAYKKIDIVTVTTADNFYPLTPPNIIEPVLLQPAKPLHLFVCFCSKLKLESCALACCIGTTTTAATSIVTAATIPTISKVEFFIYNFL